MNSAPQPAHVQGRGWTVLHAPWAEWDTCLCFPSPTAGAGPVFPTSCYLARPKPTALSVCLTLSGSLEITGMLLAGARPAQSWPHSSPAPNDLQAQAVSDALEPQVGHKVQHKEVRSQLQVTAGAPRYFIQASRHTAHSVVISKVSRRTGHGNPWVGNTFQLKRNENKCIKNVTCIHICMHVCMYIYELSLSKTCWGWEDLQALQWSRAFRKGKIGKYSSCKSSYNISLKMSCVLLGLNCHPSSNHKQCRNSRCVFYLELNSLSQPLSLLQRENK